MDTEKIVVSEAVYHMAKHCENTEQARKGKAFLADFGCNGKNPEFLPEWSSGDEDIPLEELAVIETASPEESAITSLFAKKGVFMGGTGFVPLEGSNQSVFAGIFVNSKGDKIIKVLLKDETGKFLSPVEIAHADFVLACQYDFQLPAKNDLFYGDIRRFQKDTIRAIIDRLPYRADLDYMGVLEALKSSYRQLPVNRFIPDTISVETIYQNIIRYVFTHKNEDTCKICDAYFRIQKGEMENIAEELDMTVREVCKQLKDHGLLYLTQSSVAYQTKVRVNGVPMHCYCVRKPRQKEIEAATKNALPPTVIEDGAVSLNDGRVELSAQKYEELFGEKIPCIKENVAVQSAPKANPEV